MVQTRPPTRIILCNDDGDREVRRVAAETLRPQDVFLSVPHLRGPAGTRNLGIETTMADWFVFLDDDDTFAPDYLAQAEPHLAGCTNAIPYCNYHVVRESHDGEVQKVVRHGLGRHDPALLPLRNFIPIGAYFVPAALGDLRFDPSLKQVEDWDYLLSLTGRLPLRHCNFQGSRYHKREADKTTRRSSGAQDREESVFRILERHPSGDPAIAGLQRKRIKRLRRSLSEIAP